MSNTASLENCKELYELSGRTWHEEIIFSWHKDDGEYVVEDFWSGSICPAYEAGYLLRKLPQGEVRNRDGQYSAWMNNNKSIEPVYADNPEDALALLCIKLIKEDILPISGRDL